MPHDHSSSSSNGMKMDDMNMDMDMDMNMGGMSMTFGQNWRGASLLFSFWNINNSFSYFLSLIIIALLCIFYEYLTALHEKYDSTIIERQLQRKNALMQNENENENDSGNCCNDSEHQSDERTKLASAVDVHSFQRSSGIAPPISSSSHHVRSSSSLSCGGVFAIGEIGIDFNVKEQLLRSVLYGVRSFLSLCIMMIFMIMDVGLVIAIIVGYILGYFAFQKHTTIAANQHTKQYKAGCH